jgi:tRNA(Leu) C34 or U34 (ribose-2'-O)-methylase TrmL
MATAIIGCWELGWNTPIKEFDLWTFPLRDLGCDEFHMVPVTGIDAEVIEHPDLGEFLASQRQERLIVFVDEAGETPLPEFIHPDDVLYVFGRTSLSPYTAYSQPGDESIVIPTIEDSGLLWGHQAAALVLYDRMVKSWQ